MNDQAGCIRKDAPGLFTKKIAVYSAEGAYLLPGRRWVKICPKDYFEPEVVCGKDGWMRNKV